MSATDSRYETTYPARQTHLSFLDVKQINNVYCQGELSNPIGYTEEKVAETHILLFFY